MQLNALVLGVEPDTLPMAIEESQTLDGTVFDINHALAPFITDTAPPPGFSLNSVYTGFHIELESQVNTAVAQSPERVNGLACTATLTGPLPVLPETVYDIDLDQDGSSDAAYEFDITPGRILRVQTTTQTLVDFNLPASRQFSRAELAVFGAPYPEALALAFVLHNPGPAAVSEPNTLIVLFDQPLYDTGDSLPIEESELIELSAGNPPDAGTRGYYFSLTPGQLLISALTFYGYKLVFITRSPFFDAGTGVTMYQNTLYVVDFMHQSGIAIQTTALADSVDDLVLSLNPAGSNSYYLGSHYQPNLIELPGQCIKTYQYEK